MVGNGSNGAGKDTRNGAGPGSNVSGSGAVSALLRQQELGGDRRDDQVPGGVPPLGNAMDHRGDG